MHSPICWKLNASRQRRHSWNIFYSLTTVQWSLCTFCVNNVYLENKHEMQGQWLQSAATHWPVLVVGVFSSLRFSEASLILGESAHCLWVNDNVQWKIKTVIFSAEIIARLLVIVSWFMILIIFCNIIFYILCFYVDRCWIKAVLLVLNK